MTRVLFPCHTP
ncbi:hypothetical protein D018_3760A, partial [Vibrio parahaemolyticus VP2007-007]